MPGHRELLLPDFIGVGPPRTATTWLYRVLEGRVCLPSVRKETNFFSRNFERGFDWYRGNFPDGLAPNIPVGEFSPLYFADWRAARRVAETVPRCRIIVSLRDPVEREWSHWRLLVSLGWTRRDFVSAVTNQSDLRESGRYAHHLKRWLAGFSGEQILTLIYDDLQSDPQAYLDRVCDFVGIARFPLEASPVGNERVHPVPLAPRSYLLARSARKLRFTLDRHGYHRAARGFANSAVWQFCFREGAPFAPLTHEQDLRVREIFHDEITRLEEILGRDLSAWKMPIAARERKRAGVKIRASA